MQPCHAAAADARALLDTVDRRRFACLSARQTFDLGLEMIPRALLLPLLVARHELETFLIEK